MAKFLQETLRESGLKANAHIVDSEAFKEFFRKVRLTISYCAFTTFLAVKCIGSIDRRVAISSGRH